VGVNDGIDLRAPLVELRVNVDLADPLDPLRVPDRLAGKVNVNNAVWLGEAETTVDFGAPPNQDLIAPGHSNADVASRALYETMLSEDTTGLRDFLS
jgi:hypothetical protein